MTRVLAQKAVSSVVPPKTADLAARHASNEDFEEEADRAAERAMALPPTRADEDAGREGRPRATVPRGDMSGIPKSVTRTLAEPGNPLEPGLRRDMERRFGHDFSKVRVHAGAAAADSALEVNAQAYTAGHHIVFGAGKFAPTQHDGRRLIAHELAHAIQQSPRGTNASARVLQRKPRADGAQNESAGDPAAGAANAETAVPAPAIVDLPAAVPDAPLPAKTTPAVSTVRDSPTRAPPPKPAIPASPDARAPRPRVNRPRPPQVPDEGVNAEREPTADTTPPDNSPMPPLRTLLSDRGVTTTASASSADKSSRTHAVNLSGFLATLALGAREARQAIEANSRMSLSHVDSSARRSSRQLADQTTAADDGVRRLANHRRTELDKTTLAHETEIRRTEKDQKDSAKTYTDNMKTALTDGFAGYREGLRLAFDDWVKALANLNDEQAQALDNVTTYNAKMAMRMAEVYDTEFIKSYREQSEERKEVQRNAVSNLAYSYQDAIRKGQLEFDPELEKACTQAKPELEKSRDQALVEFDKALPVVLTGIDAQYSAAIEDISLKAGEWRAKLAYAAVNMHARVNSLEAAALERNAALRVKIDGDIESGRSSASRDFSRAAALALRPIAGTLEEAVGLLTSGNEPIDEDAAGQFVDEVVDFSIDAAEATDAVFSAARDASAAKLASAVPFARRGFTAARQGFEASLHSEGVEDELALIAFSDEVEKDLKASVTALDATYKAGVKETEDHLSGMLDDTYAKLNGSLGPTVDKIKQAVTNVLFEENKSRVELWGKMVNAARQAAWRYDHPYLKHVVDTVEVAAGFIAALAIAVAIIVGLPLLLGAELAAAIFTALALVGAFFIGYFGAQRYYERRQDHQSVLSSVFGALADVTGVTDAYHAFTDPSMSPFDRGMAWGGFWLNLFGAAEAAPRFLRAIKVRLPKVFTNPFKGSMLPKALPGESILPALTEKPPPIPEARKIGFELPNTQLPEGEFPQAPAAPKPGRIGFELPHEQVPAAEAPATSGAPAPGTTPSTPKEPIGFKKPGEKLPAQTTPETPAVSRPVKGFQPLEKLAPTEPVPEAPAVSRPVKGFQPPEKLAPTEPVPETPAVSRPVKGFRPPEEPHVQISAPSGAQQPVPAVHPPEPGGVISQMPPARELPNSPRPAGSAQPPTSRPTSAIGTSTPETTMAAGGQAPSAGSPTKGSVVSTVDADLPAPPRAEPALSLEAEGRLADERSVQAAHERRLADEDRVKELQKSVEELDAMNKELGRKRERDYIHDEHEKAREELGKAVSDLRKSRRAEAEAEAAERLNLKRRKDVDPAAAQHDPVLKDQAEKELVRRRTRVEENNKQIRANDADLADAQAKVAEREQEFEKTRPGNWWTKSGRALKAERDLARESLESANRHLESVKNRTAAFEAANETHYQRMQDLDRQLHPEKYPELTGDKGDFAEGENHRVRDKEGYAFRGSSKDPQRVGAKSKPQGLDGVYEKVNPEAGGAKHIVDEVKYDTSRLREGQETAQWVDDRLDTAVGPTHAIKTRAEVMSTGSGSGTRSLGRSGIRNYGSGGHRIRKVPAARYSAIRTISRRPHSRALPVVAVSGVRR